VTRITHSGAYRRKRCRHHLVIWVRGCPRGIATALRRTPRRSPGAGGHGALSGARIAGRSPALQVSPELALVAPCLACRRHDRDRGGRAPGRARPGLRERRQAADHPHTGGILARIGDPRITGGPRPRRSPCRTG